MNLEEKIKLTRKKAEGRCPEIVKFVEMKLKQVENKEKMEESHESIVAGLNVGLDFSKEESDCDDEEAVFTEYWMK